MKQQVSTAELNKPLLMTLLIFQVALGALLMDIYVPALPIMVGFFHTTAQMVQYTLTAYLLGYSLTQLVYGPISDKYGRRPVMLFGSGLALVGLILSLVPHISITALIASRLLQGMGMAGCISLTRAMISDCYEGKPFAVVVSYLSLIVGVFPAISPFFGGLITHYWGWKMNFWVLAVIAALTFILIIFKLPETHKNKKDKLSFMIDYKALLSHKHFYCYTLISGLSYATVMVYLMLLPFIATHHWHYTPRTYGYLALVIAISLMLGKLLNVLLLKYLNVRGMICLGLGTMLLFSVVMVGVSFLPDVGMLTLVLPLIASLTGAGMIFPNATSSVYAPFRHIVGSTSALYGSLQVFVGFMAQWVASWFPAHHLGSLCWSFVVLALLANLSFYTLSTRE